jgi:hypothetical protein
MDALIDLLVLLAPAAIGLVCIAAACVAPKFQSRRRDDRHDEPLSPADP